VVAGSGRHIVSKSGLGHVFRAHNATINGQESMNQQISGATRTINAGLKRKKAEKRQVVKRRHR
jgi:hypothetical protein